MASWLIPSELQIFIFSPDSGKISMDCEIWNCQDDMLLSVCLFVCLPSYRAVLHSGHFRDPGKPLGSAFEPLHASHTNSNSAFLKMSAFVVHWSFHPPQPHHIPLQKANFLHRDNKVVMYSIKTLTRVGNSSHISMCALMIFVLLWCGIVVDSV